MGFIINGLPADEFKALVGLEDAELSKRGAIRKIADSKPGFPCRITLDDAEPGEPVILLNYESHKAATPYRSSYAIYIRENASASAVYRNELPPVMRNRPIALRIFNSESMLIGADLGRSGDETREKIEEIFKMRPDAAYIHAHNAMHGCFAAEVRPLS